MSNVFYTARKTIMQYASGSNVLIVATILAVICANAPFASKYYNALWELPVSLQIGDFNLFSHHGHPMSLMQFINDALMAIFFFNIGLEIKRESLIGELASFRQALLPIIAACGGMIFPVIVYYFLGTTQHGDYLNGMAIPMATDIAFSLGVLTMLGKRVPVSLKVFLTTLAVADDIGGILVIAIFYTTEISLSMLLASAVLYLILLIGNKLNVMNKAFYILIGIAIWYLFLSSGIHPTIAGVLVALTIPATPQVAPGKYIKTIREDIEQFPVQSSTELETKSMLTNRQLDWLKEINGASSKMISPCQELEDALQGIVTMFIIPLFAFANAGIYLGDMSIGDAFSGVALCIMGGLFIGKFIGIFLFTWATIKCKFAKMPAHSNWKMIAAVSMLGGIGFTVSLFIATLSFPGKEEHMLTLLNDAKLGIVLGSILSGVVGFIMLKLTLPKQSFDAE